MPLDTKRLLRAFPLLVGKPPGTILQHMFFLNRMLRILRSREGRTLRFLEVGPGSGDLCALLISLGCEGVLYEIDAESCVRLNQRFRNAVERGQLEIKNDDFLNVKPERVDLVLSSMVLEHLDTDGESAFLSNAMLSLNEGGHFIALVPACSDLWGVEDEVAGHYRRYERKDLLAISKRLKLQDTYVIGLTFPLSNFFLPVGNRRVEKFEESLLGQPTAERTKASGRRNVPGKTHFPSWLNILLNPVALIPFYVLQRLFGRNPRSPVLYTESQKK